MSGVEEDGVDYRYSGSREEGRVVGGVLRRLQ